MSKARAHVAISESEKRAILGEYYDEIDAAFVVGTVDGGAPVSRGAQIDYWAREAVERAYQAAREDTQK